MNKAQEITCLIAGHDPGWKRVGSASRHNGTYRVQYCCLRCDETVGIGEPVSINLGTIDFPVSYVKAP